MIQKSLFRVGHWLISVYGTTRSRFLSSLVRFGLASNLNVYHCSKMNDYTTPWCGCLSSKIPLEWSFCSKVQIVLCRPCSNSQGSGTQLSTRRRQRDSRVRKGIQDGAALHSSVAHVLGSSESSGFTISSLYTLRMASHTNRYWLCEGSKNGFRRRNEKPWARSQSQTHRSCGYLYYYYFRLFNLMFCGWGFGLILLFSKLLIALCFSPTDLWDCSSFS